MTVAEVKAYLPSCEITDAGLEGMIAGIEAELVQRYGDNISIEESFDTGRETQSIFPSRLVDTVTSVVELWGEVEYTLDVSDYEVINKRRVDRKSTGLNGRPCWGDRVKLVYKPVDDTAQRNQVIVDLVKLELAWSGADSERIGDYSMTQGDYERRRNDILSRLEVRRWA